jgi:DNA-binding response OmpR family regulator
MSSPLISCPPIGTHILQRNDETRTLVVDNRVVQFTPTEYWLLLPLLQGQPVSDTEPSEAAFSRDIDSLVRQSLEKHIDNIRGKIKHLGLSVYRLRRYGYVLTTSSD